MSDGRIDGQQFREWLRYHLALFPGMKPAFLDKLPPSGSGTELEKDYAEQMAVWYKQLNWYTLKELEAASDLLSQQEVGKKTSLGYGRHFAVVAKIAKSEVRSHGSIYPKQVYQDGEQVYQCDLCRDEGCRIVWGPVSIRYALGRGPIEKLKLGDDGTLYQTTVACTCSTGRGYFARQMTTFDDKLHLPLHRWEDGAQRYVIGQMEDAAEQGRLVAWAEVRVKESGQQQPQQQQTNIPF